MSFQIDQKLFHRRLRLLHTHFKNASRESEDVYFHHADALVVASGESNEELPYQKTTCLQTWLFGAEFPETVMCLTGDVFVVLTSQKKASYLEPLVVKMSEKQIPVVLLKRAKDGSNEEEIFEEFVGYVKKSRNGRVVGMLNKDVFSGRVYGKCVEKMKEFERVDVTFGISTVLAVKDEEGLNNTRIAAKVVSEAMKNNVVNDLMRIIDEERNVKHEDFSGNIEGYFVDEKKRKKLRLNKEVDENYLDICYTPVIQSGGKYNLKPSAVSNSDIMKFGTIICFMGVRYKSYCSNLGRTFFVDPKKEQEENYEFLIELQRYVLGLIRDGVLIKDVYMKGVEFVEKNRPELKSKLVKNFGFGIGLEFKEGDFTINGKNENEIVSGMTLNLAIGFQDLEIQGENYSLFVADTIKVTSTEPIILTDAPKRLKEITFEIGEQEEKQQVSKTKVLRSKLRTEEKEELNENKRREHQHELHERLNKEMLSLYKKNNSENNKVVEEMNNFESYKREALLPREVSNLKIFVDKRAESVVLPIYGLAVPFHISTIKNATKSDEGDGILLRINFNTPVKKEVNENSVEEFVLQYIRTISFKSSDVIRLTEVFKDINELRKMITKKATEKKEMADLVEQEKLIESKNKLLVLKDVYVRPIDGKRSEGSIEIHSNGLRFTSFVKRDFKLDLIFSNIKHLFFQPCDNELIAILHIHLKNPILIGKKKTKDVQFYREVTDLSYDETGGRGKRRNNYADEDELIQEQEERKRRARINSEFKQFAEKVMEQSNIEVDIPFRELGFNGVPFRQNVLMQPTTECLVHLTDTPFLVVTLPDVELALLERVSFGLKNFDLVFVFKNHNLQPVHINSIPMNSLEHIKDWLDSMDVAYAEAPVNFNWNNLLKVVKEDPIGFYEMGGWNFARGDDVEQQDEEHVSSESGSEFNDEQFNESESNESDFDDDEEFDEDDDAEEDEDEEDEDGLDWDDLEEQTRREEKEKEKKRILLEGKTSVPKKLSI
ncbi:FACT complex subunit Spt16p/Cdc68p domain-containing protein [Rozella allomycis CSF55]|uniref:FACT complex subunit n=1 Tax=Rozella allomycis (strain CSF55) TaxID=988480 RepID=A0A075AVD9_ROZAC|nr:FACT complex subunit Spt16p/Cdc68p domain-containing protein [Rozella allomycis CSF55]|eukprot:EPZ34080.1 FACT complex subunit Spt16p/Cdc68p domain-containing protein [Rozella allomycis CSF55]